MYKQTLGVNVDYECKGVKNPTVCACRHKGLNKDGNEAVETPFGTYMYVTMEPAYLSRNYLLHKHTLR